MAEIKFDSNAHIYYVDGKKTISVTQALAVLSDFSNIRTDVLKRAGDFGTACHLATALYDQRVLDESVLDDNLKPHLSGWKLFLKDSGFAIEAIEKIVYSQKYGYCGTIDRVGILNGRRAVIDIKTGQVSPTMAIQLSAYLTAYNEEMPYAEKAQDRMIVQLKEDGTYSLPKKEFYKTTDFGVFKACLTIAKWKRAS